MKLPPCPLCGNKTKSTGEGPDQKLKCIACKATWTLDGK